MSLSPISVAGYVRTLKVLGNWLAAEELAQAAALRTLRKPRVPDKLVESIGDDAMRRLLAVADVRDRAILLLLLDCGLRVSEAAGLRLGDLRPDGTLKVTGKGAKERIVPVGGTARTAIVRYMGQRGAGAPDEPLFLGRRGALDWRGMQQVLKRLKGRAGITACPTPGSKRSTRGSGCSPGSPSGSTRPAHSSPSRFWASAACARRCQAAERPRMSQKSPFKDSGDWPRGPSGLSATMWAISPSRTGWPSLTAARSFSQPGKAHRFPDLANRSRCSRGGMAIRNPMPRPGGSPVRARSAHGARTQRRTRR